MKAYLLIYLVTIILCIIETNLEYVTIGVRKISTSVFSTIIIYPYILLLGVLRSEVLGVDTLNYKNNYWDVYKNLDLLNAIKYDSDVGYGLMNWGISRFTSDFWVFRAILFAITFSIISVWIWKYSKNVALSYFIFIALGFIGFDFTILRQALAVSLSVWSYKYLIERKTFKFVLIVLLAAFFHKTALIMLLIYPLLSKRVTELKKWIKIVYLIGAGSIVAIGGKVIATLYHRNDYTLDVNQGHGYSLLLFYIGIFLIVYFFIQRISQRDELLYEYDIAISSIYVQIIATSLSIFTRMLKYTTSYLFVLIPDVMDKLDKKTKNVMLVVVILVMSVLFLKSHGAEENIIPYMSHFMDMKKL